MVDLDDIRRTLIACKDVPWSCACITPQELEALVEEVERLRGERAAVVAWLREGALGTDVTQHESYGHAFADGIERGEHRRTEEEP